MSNYKLKKLYPCLPDTWYVGLIVEKKYNVYNPNEAGVCCVTLDCDQVEKYPEFWEKVVEKDYEILSFIRTGSSNYDGTEMKDFLSHLEVTYNEKDCYMCTNKVPEEGIILRIEYLESYEAYKLKSKKFTLMESEAQEKEEINIEDE